MKYDDYQALAATFRAGLYTEAEKMLEERVWPDPWLSLPARLTCHTKGCAVAAGPAVHLDLHENADGLYRASCGICGQQITDVVGLFDDGERALPV